MLNIFLYITELESIFLLFGTYKERFSGFDVTDIRYLLEYLNNFR